MALFRRKVDHRALQHKRPLKCSTSHVSGLTGCPSPCEQIAATRKGMQQAPPEEHKTKQALNPLPYYHWRSESYPILQFTLLSVCFPIYLLAYLSRAAANQPNIFENLATWWFTVHRFKLRLLPCNKKYQKGKHSSSLCSSVCFL